MKSIKKKLCAWLMTAAMAVSVLPMGAFAGDTAWADGTYTGSGTGFQSGEIQLNVTIDGGEITGIKTVKAEKQSYWDSYNVESLFEKIIAKQSTDVDAVSGATKSSNGLKAAVEDALRQAAEAESPSEDAVFSKGSGTESDPYLLETEAQLRALARSVNSGTDYAGRYIELTKDIALSGETWTPIGTAEGQTAVNGFAGVFDGNGHSISGMTIGTKDEPADMTNAGLFGALTAGAEIYDLGVTGASIYTSCSGTEKLPRPVVGVLASYVSGGKEASRGSAVIIDGCWATGTVVNRNAVRDRYAYVGGLVGTTSSEWVIANCWTDVSVTAAGRAGANFAGGIIGMDSNSGVMANCATFGSVAVELGGQYNFTYWGAGGIAGQNSAGIFNCYSAGGTALSEDMPEEDYPVGIGAVSGGFSYEDDSDIYSAYGCYFNKDAAQTVAGESLGSPVAASVSAMGYWNFGYGEDDVTKQEYCYGKPESFFGTQELADAMNAGLDAEKIDEAGDKLNTEPSDYIPLLKNGLRAWALTDGRVLPAGAEKEESPFEGGKGTESEPYEIKTEEQLALFAASVTGGNSYAGQFIRLTRDLTLGDAWTPIEGFGGSFDGAGHTISHVRVSADGAYAVAGLFGTLLDNAEIRDLHLEDVEVSSSAKGTTRSYAGALAGKAGDNVMIDHCSVSGGSVSAEQSAGSYAYGGGLVGYMGMENIVANSSADVSVSASSKRGMAMAGGLTAGSGLKGLIMNCVALGSVHASGKPLAGSVFGGGLTGFPTGAVYNCYAGGDVTVENLSEYEGSPRAGALIGRLYEGTAAISLYYSASAVLTADGETVATVANGDASGVEKNITAIPAGSDMSVVASMLNKGLSQASVSAADAYLASVAGQMSGGYAEGEFSEMCAKIPVRYAITTDETGKLTVSDTEYQEPEGPDIFDGGSGTKADPYRIATETQLRQFASSCGEELDYAGEYIVLTRDIELTEEWQPVGWQADDAYFFCGSFDGQGHTISGMTIGTKSEPVADSEYSYKVYYGLFAGLGDLAVVKNLALTDVSIHLTSEASLMAGAVAGYSLNAGIDSCSATGSISVKTTNPEEELFNANCFAGGIVGNISGGYLINSWTDMELSAEARTANAEAGGLAGLTAYGLIANCYALGNVSGVTDRTVHDGGMAYVSGLVGCQAARMFNCYTMGSLNSASYSKMVGFLAGMSTGISETSYNYYNSDAQQLIDGLEVEPKTPFGVMVSSGTGEDGDSFPGCLAEGNEAKSASELRSQAFADLLNSRFAAFPADVESELPQGTFLKKWIVRDDVVTFGDEAAEITYVPVERPESKTVYVDGEYLGRDFVGEDYTQEVILRAAVLDGSVTEITLVKAPDGLDRDEAQELMSKALNEQKAPEAQSGDSAWQLAVKGALETLLSKAAAGDTSGYGLADPSIFDGGTGTQDDPYRIATAGQLQAFAAAVNIDEGFEGQYIVLTSDIDLGGVEWSPAGIGGNIFSGTFDGQNHIIRNLTMGTAQNPSHHALAGLFTNLDGAVVKNLGLADASIYLKRTDDKRSYAGLVAARVQSTYTGRAAVITNCVTSGVIHNDANSWSYCGGIAGSTLYNLIENCTSTVEIEASSVSATVVAGGIVGVDGFTGLRNCSAFGSITADGGVNAVSIGGIAGMKSGPGLNCYTDVKLISKAAAIDVGGIAGRNTGTGIMDTNYFSTEAEQKAGTRTISPAQGLGLNVDYGDWLGIVERLEGRTAAELRTESFRDELNANRENSELLKLWNDYVKDYEILGRALEAPEMDEWVLTDGTVVLKNAPVLHAAAQTAAARIGDTEYETLQAAVDAAEDGDVITVLQSGLSATVSGSKSFTLNLADGADKPVLKAARGYSLVCDGNTYTVSKKSSGGSSSGSASTVSSVTVSSAKNGSVSTDVKNAGKGDTVTVTARADSGYVLDSLTVKDASGRKLELTDLGSGRYSFTMPASGVTVSAKFVETSSGSFADVPDGAYYADAVRWAVEKGITSGVSDTAFDPNAACTRAQIVTFLWRASGSPEPKSVSGFADVSQDSYYAKAVAWAVENGVTSGTGDGLFEPNAACTRAQSVTFLWRALGKPAAAGAAFSDVASDSYYAGAVAWAVENGVTNGISDGLFGPDSSCTRAQIVTFLWRAYQGA